MEKTIEGWIAKDLNGIHIFENKPRKERFTQQSMLETLKDLNLTLL